MQAKGSTELNFKTCKDCGLSFPKAAKWNGRLCYPCLYARRRAKYASDPEYRKSRNAKACAISKANPEKGRLAMRRRRAQPGYKQKAAQKYQENQEAIRAYHKLWRAAHPENPAVRKTRYLKRLEADEAAVRAAQRAYYLANKDHWPSKVNKRRAAKAGAGGSHTEAEIKALLAKQSEKCANLACIAPFKKSGKNRFHRDHIVPLSAGGSDSIDNIALLCPRCNLSKHDKLPEEWAKQNGLLFY